MSGCSGRGRLGMLIGLTLPVVLLGPEGVGLHMGATGLAVKTVALQAIQVNIGLWLNAGRLRLPFGSLMTHQVVPVAAFAAVGWCAILLTDLAALGLIGSLMAAGVLHVGACAALCWTYPRLLGLERADLRSARDQLREALRRAMRA